MTTLTLTVAEQLTLIRAELAKNLAYAERKAEETGSGPSWLVWRGRADACRETLASLDSLAR